MSSYRELPPRPELREQVACLWYRTVDHGEAVGSVRVVPDACVDVVWEAGRAPVIAGPDTRAVLSHLAAGTVIAGVRFRTGRAPELLGVTASELRDARPLLEDAWGAREIRRLRESDGVGSPLAMLEALQATLRGRPVRDRRWDGLLRALAAWASGPATLDELARDLLVAERTLRRRVEELVGYGPKTLQRIVRFQRMLRLADRAFSLADLAAAAGYADQAHLTRECRSLSGLTPGQLLRERATADDRWREGREGPRS